MLHTLVLKNRAVKWPLCRASCFLNRKHIRLLLWKVFSHWFIRKGNMLEVHFHFQHFLCYKNPRNVRRKTSKRPRVFSCNKIWMHNIQWQWLFCYMKWQPPSAILDGTPLKEPCTKQRYHYLHFALTAATKGQRGAWRNLRGNVGSPRCTADKQMICCNACVIEII